MQELLKKYNAKESLTIEDRKKGFYYRGLSEWRNEKGWLTDTCLDGQDTFVRLLDMLDIPHNN